MKRNRHENVKNIVSSYLKRRNYTPSDAAFRRSEFSKGITVRELVQEEALKTALAQENVVSFNSVGPDLSALDLQLTRFKSWLVTLPQDNSKELAHLLPLLLSHMYIEAVGSGANRLSALKFLKRHHLPSVQPDDLLDELIATGICPEILTKPSIMRFRSGRTLLKASRKSILLLEYYLTGCEHAHLLQVLGQWVQFVRPGAGALEELEDAAGMKGMNEAIIINSSEPGTMSPIPEEGEEAEISALKAAFKAVEDGPLFPTPLRVFYVMNCENNPIACAAFGSKATLLATGLETGSVQVWSLTQDCLASGLSNQKMLGHTAPVRSLCWLGNKALISGSVDHDIRLWPSENQTSASVYRGHLGSVFSLAVSPLYTYFASASDDLSLKLWSPEFAFPLRSYCAHTQAPLAVDFHPNGHYLASGSKDCSVRLWATAEGRLIRLFTGHRAGVRCLSFSPDGKSLASAGFESVIRVWDLAQGSCRLELPCHADGINQLTWSKDCSVLAAASPSGIISEWDLSSEPRPLATYNTYSKSVLGLHFSAHNLTCTCTAL